MALTVAGERSATTALTMTLDLAPWRTKASIRRWMPTSTPYAAQEIAMVSSTPAGSGLPIGLMPGALPSDQASRQTLKTTAMRLSFGQTQFGLFFIHVPGRRISPKNRPRGGRVKSQEGLPRRGARYAAA